MMKIKDFSTVNLFSCVWCVCVFFFIVFFFSSSPLQKTTLFIHVKRTGHLMMVKCTVLSMLVVMVHPFLKRQTELLFKRLTYS